MNVLLAAIAGVWIIVGTGPLHCDDHGCTARSIYWTDRQIQFAPELVKGWSYDWKAAQQYSVGTDINYVIPNGSHCCYSEEPTRIDPATGAVLGYGLPE